MKNILITVVLTLGIMPASILADQEITFSPTFDNLLMYSSSNANVANTVYATSENSVGIDHFYTYSYDYLSAISLIYFDLSSIIGDTVTSAYLNLYPTVLAGDPAGAASRTDYKLNPIYSGWDPSTVTWNTAPSYRADEILFEVPILPIAINVTSIVQKWANGTWINSGFMLQDAYYQPWSCNCLDSTSFGALGSDASKVPKLIVTIAIPDCDDSNLCTTDYYDQGTGTCVNTPINCNDSNACTTDSCNPAIGCTYTAVSCNDGDACTVDSCDPVYGCIYTPTACSYFMPPVINYLLD